MEDLKHVAGGVHALEMAVEEIHEMSAKKVVA